ncbi:hypothetical protein [Streptomyces sp. NPDC048481]|uniref:hypothetical protein n=1 Tax=Streptomyces sp. NPDC048481 TaxID=3365557 RepID=UPI00371AB257
MECVLEVGVGEGTVAQDPAGEPGRVLRYRSGGLKHDALEAGNGAVVYDFAGAEVGRWRIVAS